MQKSIRQLMDDLAHIDAGHQRRRVLKGFNRHSRDLHHEDTWLEEAQPARPGQPRTPAPRAPVQPVAGAKKWPVGDAQIRAFQAANPPLVVDGLIGSKTLAVLTQQGYTPPPGFRPVADKAGAAAQAPGQAVQTGDQPGGSVTPTGAGSASATYRQMPNGELVPIRELPDDESRYTVDDWREQAAQRGGPASIPAKGDFSGGASGKGRMPPGEVPPGSKPFKNNPTIQYVYKGQVYDKRDGYPISDESPMLAPGQVEREEESKWDIYGNREGSYKVLDVCPVVSEPGLQPGGAPNEMDRIQKGFGRGMKMGATWDFKGAAITIWYRPEGGKGRMSFDISTLPQIMGDWAGSFKNMGYNMTNLNDNGRVSNRLGNGLGEEFSLLNSQGQPIHGGGTAQQVAFQTADGTKSYATVDVSFLGPEAVWKSGGKEAWQKTYDGLRMASGLTQLSRNERPKKVPNYRNDIDTNG
jgi:hypothetical protein